MTNREKLTKLVEESFADQYNRRRMIVVPDTVNHLLANGVVVRENGEWISLTECANAGVYCSVCNKKVWKEDYARCNRKNKLRSNFCPNCGADMRIEEQNRAKGENG